MQVIPGSVILTPNQRMALWWQRKKPSMSVSVYPWTQWVDNLWEQGSRQALPGFDLSPLSSVGQEIVWEKIIKGSLQDRPLMRLLPTVRLALQAWQQLKTWDIPLDKSLFQPQEDTRWFWD